MFCALLALRDNFILDTDGRLFGWFRAQISHRADGAAKERPVGAALAQVVGTVMYGTDPLQLAYKAAKSGEREEE
jgi:hypothetical protein